MPIQDPIYRKSLFIALPLALTIGLAGVLLHDQVVPTEQPSLSDRATADSTTTQDQTVSEPDVVSGDESKPMPPELEAIQRRLQDVPPMEQEQEQSQAVIAKADALIEQTDAMLANAGHPTGATTKAQTAQETNSRIAELRAKASELQERKKSLQQ